jgi:ADP-ribosyl-[dinitrogen reductase] hydrolase
MESRYTGCLLGGAIGDALGAPVEFMSRNAILRVFGPGGIREYDPAYGRAGAITDDTQMTLFTAEGLLDAARDGHPPGHRAYVEACAGACLRWLLTQQERPDAHAGARGLLGNPAFHSRRAPGNTCLSALRELHRAWNPAAVGAGHARDYISVGAGNSNGPRDPSTLRARNNSKGCGGVMRVAPAGLLIARQVADEATMARTAFTLGADLAAITHGHPSGYLSAGAFATMVAVLVRGGGLRDALARAEEILATRDGCEETLAALQVAARLAARGPANHDALVELGGGWVGEEALAIGVYCALAAEDFGSALRVAVNHAGDSDSTGAITGNLLGIFAPELQHEHRWVLQLESADDVSRLARQLAAVAPHT